MSANIQRRLGSMAVALLAISAGFISTACFRMYDAWIVNPCNASLRIDTFDGRPLEVDGFGSLQSATLPPNSRTKVRDAFSDAGGYDWSLRVVGYPQIILVDGKQWKDNTVDLPGKVCATTYHPPPLP